MNRLSLVVALSLAAVVAPAGASAQQYVVSQSPIVYTPIVGGQNVGIQGDDNAALVQLGFTFSYFGNNYTQVGVSTNGVVMMGATTTSYSNTTIPSGVAPNNAIFAWWDDSSVSAAGDVTYLVSGVAPNREFVVQYANWPHLGGGAATRNLQVHLYEANGIIQIHYGANNNASDTASVGIEDSTGAVGHTGLACTPNCTAATWPTNEMVQFGVSNDPDVTPSVALGPMVANGGNIDFSVDVTVRNLGAAEATPLGWDLYLSDNGTLDPATDTLLGSHAAVETIPGQQALVFNDPLSTLRPLPGQYWVCVDLDPTNVITPEANESNNRGCTPAPFLIGADLFGTVSVPAQGAPGESVPVTVRIENRGSDVTGSFTYEIWFSADTTLDGSDDLLFTGTTQLDGTDFYSAVEDVFVPELIGGTQHYAILKIDSTAVVPEADEANNLAVSSARVELIKGDLRLISVEASFVGGCYFGDDVTMDYEVCNDGGGNARGFVISVMLSDNAVVTITDPELAALPQSCPGSLDSECTEIQPGSATCSLGTCAAPCSVDADCGPNLDCDPSGSCANHLAPGECRTYRQTITLPATGFSSAEYFLGVIVDSVDQVNEQNEGNNIKHTQSSYLCREPSLDLVTTALAPPARMAAGEASPVFRVIRNAGNLAGSFEYRYYLSSNQVLSTGDIPLDVLSTGGAGVGTLDRYTEDQSSDLVLIPSSVAPGDYYLGLIVDPDGAVAELDETNNVFVSPTQIRVDPSSLRVATGSLPDCTVGLHYSRYLVATGGDGSYSWTGADLPAGFTLAADGLLAGVPQERGVTAFTVAVQSGGSIAEALLALRCNPATSALAVATTTLPPASAGRPYNVALAAVGGFPPYSWAISGGVLPGGLSLSNSAINGTPAVAGDSCFSVRVTDSQANHASRDLCLPVLDAADLAITSQRFTEGIAGEPYLACAEATGGDGSYSWSFDGSSAPPGLAAEQQGSRGCLKGTPLSCGTFVVSISVQDGTGQGDTAELPLTVLCDRLLLRTDELLAVYRGQVVEETLDSSASGAAVYRLLAGDLPEGLGLDEAGVLAGTVAATAELGTHHFVVEITDRAGGYGLGALSILVLPDPLPAGVDPDAVVETDDGGCGCTTGAGSPLAPLGSLLLAAVCLLPLLARKRRSPRSTGGRALLAGVAGLLAFALPGLASAQQTYTLRQYPIVYTPIVNGTNVGASGDDAAAAVNIGFDVQFYGQSYSQVGVSTNGTVHFGGTSYVYWNTTIPDAADPNNIIFAWQDDSQVRAASDLTYTVVGAAPTREFIIQWANWPHLGGAQNREMQVHLFEGSSTIVVMYGANAGASDSATVGIEDPVGGPLSVTGLACNPNCSSANWPTNQAISYSQGPDVVVSSVTGEAVGYAGVAMHLEATATNVGGADANGFGMRFWVSRDGLPSADDRLLGDAAGVQSATPGVSATFSLDEPLPADLSPGDYYIVAQVDPLNAVAEDSEGNNSSAYGPFPLGIPAPDLTVESISVPGSARPGEAFDLRWVVRNLGNDVATAVPYSLVISENNVVTASDRAIFSGTIDAQPLTTGDILEQVTMPGDVRAGTYYLGIVIDPENLVYELDELNNLGVSQGDFTVTSVSVDILTTTLPAAQVGAVYCKLLEASGGDGSYAWSVAAGSELPPGLGLEEEPSGARERGDPYGTLLCGSASVAGNFEFTLEVSSGGFGDSQAMTLEVTTSSLPLTVVSVEVPTAAFQVPYEAGLSAVGGQVPYGWSLQAGALPAGLTVRGDGMIVGVAQVDGAFPVTVQVQDAAGATASQDVVVRVAPPGTLVCASTMLPGQNVGHPYLETLYAAGGAKPYTWSSVETRRLVRGPGDEAESFPEAPPPGLVLSSSGTVSGAPSSAGLYLWTVLVEDRSVDGSGAASPLGDTCTLTVDVGVDQGLSVITRGLPDALVDEEYEAQIEVAGGEGFLTFGLAEGSELPDGLALSEDGVIDGVLGPDALEGRETRAFNFLVQVKDSQNRSGVAALSIMLRTRPQPAAPADDGGAGSGGSDTGGCQAAGAGPTVLGLLLALGLLAASRNEPRRNRKTTMISGKFGGIRGTLVAAALATGALLGGATLAGCDDAPDQTGGAGGSAPSGDPCETVTCSAANLQCDPADGICKCGGANGVVCLGDDSCVLEPSPTCVSVACELSACTNGNTCDPATGECRCGGSGTVTCEGIQQCNPATRNCEPGLCENVPCNRGQLCDPGDGACKCGAAPCGDGEACQAGVCATADLCTDPRCGAGQSCDAADGICKCGGNACSFGQRCEAGACVADSCGGVNCSVGTTCNPADGLCHCGDPSGQVCTAGQACVETAGTYGCAGSQLCSDAAQRCRGGTTCDPADGQCRCGGLGPAAPICGANQTCDISEGTCLGGNRCQGVSCAEVPGTSCDPEDGVCRCGGLGGVECTEGQVCISADGPTCADRCNPVGNPTGCVGDTACYFVAAEALSYCTEPGGLPQDSGCRGALECAPGLHCTLSSATPVCRLYCRVPQAGEADTCPGDDICLQLDGAPAGMGTCRTVN